MRTIALLQYKGGTAKTTTTVQLACTAVHEFKLRTVVLDTDEQGSAAKWHARRRRDEPTVIRVEPAAAASLLLGIQNDFDLALIDTPGHSYSALSAAAVCADLSIVASSPTQLDLEAAVQVCNSLRDFSLPYALLLTRAPPRMSEKLAAWVAVYSNQGVTATPMLSTLVAYQDSVTVGLGVAEYEPSGRAAMEVRAILEWILNRLREQN